MQSNSELANSWNIKQNTEEENSDTDIEDDMNETSPDETYNSNKSLTKYDIYYFSNKITWVFYNSFVQKCSYIF